MARKKQMFNMMQYGTKNNGRTTLIQRNEKKSETSPSSQHTRRYVKRATRNTVSQGSVQWNPFKPTEFRPWDVLEAWASESS